MVDSLQYYALIYITTAAICWVISSTTFTHAIIYGSGSQSMVVALSRLKNKVKTTSAAQAQLGNNWLLVFKTKLIFDNEFQENDIEFQKGGHTYTETSRNHPRT